MPNSSRVSITDTWELFILLAPLGFRTDYLLLLTVSFCTHFNRKSGEEIPAGRRPCGPGFCTKADGFLAGKFREKESVWEFFKIDKLNVSQCSWSTQKNYFSHCRYIFSVDCWSYNSPLAPISTFMWPWYTNGELFHLCELLSAFKVYHFCKDHREDNERKRAEEYL